jgi:SAM-dependent methyltransferase
MRIGTKFLESYFQKDMSLILEIGSYDVNGSLRKAKPSGSTWVGMDIEAGPGVDIVASPDEEIPFPDSHFDVVLATSVFEHDPQFWRTLEKMARVVKPTGLIYICAPSNGPVHRYPQDCFRFYPDASQAFLKVIQGVHPGAIVSESFIANQDHEGVWNDLVAIFAMKSDRISGIKKLYETESCSNVWDGELFLENTFIATAEDRRQAERLQQLMLETEQRNDLLVAGYIEKLGALVHERDAILRTISWRWTSPIRYLRQILARSVRFGRSLVRKV